MITSSLQLSLLAFLVEAPVPQDDGAVLNWSLYPKQIESVCFGRSGERYFSGSIVKSDSIYLLFDMFDQFLAYNRIDRTISIIAKNRIICRS